MTPAKVRQVIDLYRIYFEELDIEPADYPEGKNLEDKLQGVAHCLGMIPKMEKFIEENRIEKAMRWLGFIQGALWMAGLFTLKQLKEQNRQS